MKENVKNLMTNQTSDRETQVKISCLLRLSGLSPSPSPGAGREIILSKLFLKFEASMHVLKNKLKIISFDKFV